MRIEQLPRSESRDDALIVCASKEIATEGYNQIDCNEKQDDSHYKAYSIIEYIVYAYCLRETFGFSVGFLFFIYSFLV